MPAKLAAYGESSTHTNARPSAKKNRPRPVGEKKAAFADARRAASPLCARVIDAMGVRFRDRDEGHRLNDALRPRRLQLKNDAVSSDAAAARFLSTAAAATAARAPRGAAAPLLATRGIVDTIGDAAGAATDALRAPAKAPSRSATALWARRATWRTPRASSPRTAPTPSARAPSSATTSAGRRSVRRRGHLICATGAALCDGDLHADVAGSAAYRGGRRGGGGRRPSGTPRRMRRQRRATSLSAVGAAAAAVPAADMIDGLALGTGPRARTGATFGRLRRRRPAPRARKSSPLTRPDALSDAIRRTEGDLVLEAAVRLGIRAGAMPFWMAMTSEIIRARQGATATGHSASVNENSIAQPQHETGPRPGTSAKKPPDERPARPR